MRRVTLLALLALGLPTAALAKSITYDTGKFEHGSFTGSFTTSISATEVGSQDTIVIDTGTLTKLPMRDCKKGFSCYDFSGGSIKITHDGTTVFTDSLKGGVLEKGYDSLDIYATLLADAMVAQGTTVATLEFGNPPKRGRVDEHHTTGSDRHGRGRERVVQHHPLDTGNIEVSVNTATPATTPEPGTLGLLGTGLVGLAGLARRKLTRGV
jgi:hypothetical protein